MIPSRFYTHYISKSGRLAVATGLENVNPHPISKKGSTKELANHQIKSHSSPILVRACLKSCMLAFSTICTKNFQMSKMGLEKEEELEIELPTFP